MNDFRFGEPIKICGKEYWMDTNTKEKQEKLTKLRGKITEIEKNKDTPEKVMELIGYIKEMIDMVITEGAFDEIFSGREVKTKDVTAVLNYIRAEMEA